MLLDNGRLGQSEAGGVPSFAEARTRRGKARVAGLDPNHWYAAEYADRVTGARPVATRFWDTPIVLFRGEDGKVGALEDRCAHRQVKLSLGSVAGCSVVCPYHGWRYDRTGQLESVAHELYGRSVSQVRLRAFPVQERYGLVWIFPGEPARANETPVPNIPELEGEAPWSAIRIDFTWAAHFSMIVENVSDFSHAYLHRRFRPFNDAKLVALDTVGSDVRLTYDVLVGDGRFSKHFVDKRRVKVDRMDLGFSYPYQWSDTGGRIKHWCFFLPLDATTTRVFFLFYFDAIRIPLLGFSMPRWLQGPILQIAKRMMIRPLLSEDGWMVEAEQAAYAAAPQAPFVELNPAVPAFQDVIINRWQHVLDRRVSTKAEVVLERAS